MRNEIKEYNVLNDKAQLEYIIKTYCNDEGIVYQLITSNSEIWTEQNRNKTILTATDDGNGIEWFNCGYNDKLDYSEFIEMFILFSFIKNYDENISGKYEILKSELILTL